MAMLVPNQTTAITHFTFPCEVVLESSSLNFSAPGPILGMVVCNTVILPPYGNCHGMAAEY